MLRRRWETAEDTQNPELMVVAYEVGGSVATGLKGHIPLSEHNGCGKSPSLTDTLTERRVWPLCVYLQQNVFLCLFKGKVLFLPEIKKICHHLPTLMLFRNMQLSFLDKQIFSGYLKVDGV